MREVALARAGIRDAMQEEGWELVRGLVVGLLVGSWVGFEVVREEALFRGQR